MCTRHREGRRTGPIAPDKEGLGDRLIDEEVVKEIHLSISWKGGKQEELPLKS